MYVPVRRQSRKDLFGFYCLEQLCALCAITLKVADLNFSKFKKKNHRNEETPWDLYSSLFFPPIQHFLSHCFCLTSKNMMAGDSHCNEAQERSKTGFAQPADIRLHHDSQLSRRRLVVRLLFLRSIEVYCAKIASPHCFVHKTCIFRRLARIVSIKIQPLICFDWIIFDNHPLRLWCTLCLLFVAYSLLIFASVPPPTWRR